MDLMFELLVSALIVVSALFTLIGSWGMVKLPELMSRLHAPTKATTLGVGGALLASMIYFAAFEGVLSLHELLVSVFLFLTAPITAHFLAKAHILGQVDPAKELPPAGERGWSTFDAAAEAGGERRQERD
jgi:multicomponent K+:H+ antiporter subunit G